jgi:hypothetical protein
MPSASSLCKLEGGGSGAVTLTCGMHDLKSDHYSFLNVSIKKMKMNFHLQKLDLVFVSLTFTMGIKIKRAFQIIKSVLQTYLLSRSIIEMCSRVRICTARS